MRVYTCLEVGKGTDLIGEIYSSTVLAMPLMVLISISYSWALFPSRAALLTHRYIPIDSCTCHQAEILDSSFIDRLFVEELTSQAGELLWRNEPKM